MKYEDIKIGNYVWYRKPDNKLREVIIYGIEIQITDILFKAIDTETFKEYEFNTSDIDEITDEVYPTPRELLRCAERVKELQNKIKGDKNEI